MSFLHMLQQAAMIFVAKAFPAGPSDEVQAILAELAALDSESELLKSTLFEHEDDHYSLRLGSYLYPHTKLVFILNQGQPSFYVDAHDSHFSLPQGIPLPAELVALRAANQKLKREIEACWVMAKLPVFGASPPIPCPPATNGACAGMKVLVIDDETTILDMMGLILKRLGAKCVSADSLSSACAAISDSDRPDMVFCDIMMPGHSGYEFVDWLKANNYKIPVCYITGLNLKKVERNGVAAVLQKPFTAQNVATIVQTLNGKRLAGQLT